MCNWLTLLHNGNTVSQRYFNGIYILRKKKSCRIGEHRKEERGEEEREGHSPGRSTPAERELQDSRQEKKKPIKEIMHKETSNQRTSFQVWKGHQINMHSAHVHTHTQRHIQGKISKYRTDTILKFPGEKNSQKSKRKKYWNIQQSNYWITQQQHILDYLTARSSILKDNKVLAENSILSHSII